MLSRIKAFFENNLELNTEADASSIAARVHMAVTALLIEIAYADYEVSQVEREKLLKLLHQRFGIAEDALITLSELAEQEVKDATSLYQFTRLINDHYDFGRKFELVKAMWEIALSDGLLDKYEEATIRKISDLLYLPHSELMRAKHEAG